MQRRNPHAAYGFTIVELLVVIVIIGILAAITLVAYTGISQRAVVASVQSDLSSASQQLNLFQVANSAYPSSVTDCPTPVATDLCLKLSSGNSVSSYSANNQTNPPSYSLAIANGSNTYEVTNNTQPTQLASAPLSPVADWLATTRGDHYGNFYDLVGHNWATVTRTGAKTIYDPATQKIYDVPANYLGVNPRSDGKSGSEAVIEESRTNYLLNSYFAADSNSDGLADNWNFFNTVTGTVVPTRTSSSVYGTSQRVRYTGIPGDSGAIHVRLDSDRTASGSFNAGDTAVFSAFFSGSVNGTTARIRIYARNDSGAYLGTADTSITLTSTPTLQTLMYSSLPSGTTSVTAGWTTDDNVTVGTTIDVSISAAQVEKGTFATSYIPTTTTAVTRNTDVVTVPTTSWSLNSGTYALVAGDSSYRTSSGPAGGYWYWGGSNFLSGYTAYGASYMTTNTPSNGTQYDDTGITAGYHTRMGSWLVGNSVRAWVDGSPGSRSDTYYAVTGGNTTANIGSGNMQAYNGPIQRLTVYNSALSSGNITTVTNAVQNGP